MKTFIPLSNVDQLAAHLRQEMRDGTLSGTLPGVASLVKQLGVGTKTVVAAIEQLEKDGLLVSQGMRRSRKIVEDSSKAKNPLRIRILLYDADDALQYYHVELQQRLQNMGHSAKFATKTLMEMGMDVTRVARFVNSHPADAWVVFSGSLEVLKWFEQQSTPVIAFAGRRQEVNIASIGPNKLDVIREIVRKLHGFGHRRIVLLARDVRRLPHPGKFERTFLDELEKLGIPQGAYNLPNWTDTAEGLKELLDSLFRVTPPTAIIVEEPAIFIAVQSYLAQQGILAPRDISLICDDPDPAFAWCRPSVAHIRWNTSQCVRHIVRWANNLTRGKNVRRASYTNAEFVEGGTVGPAPRKQAQG